jgi:hypothetical protein
LTKYAVIYRMLVVEASCLYEVVTGTPGSDRIREYLIGDTDHVAPHIIDVEVMSVIRRNWLAGHLDDTAADQTIEDLTDWPGANIGTGRRRLVCMDMATVASSGNAPCPTHRGHSGYKGFYRVETALCRAASMERLIQ